jgi:2,3-bisphosphoglycerate-independent phosphoglycerate mutase
MKYLIVVPDGAADDPIPSLEGKTPLEVANLPTFDELASKGEVGTCRTVPEGISPGSDSANLSVMGYDPRVYLTGRSPLEAGALGIDMKEVDESFRVNFITVEPTETGRYEDFIIKDHASGDITTEEAAVLLEVLKEEFEKENLKFYLGTQYRHCMIISNQKVECDFVPPHDVLERTTGQYLPKGKDQEFLIEMTKKSYELFADHPINKDRIARGLNPANSIWVWGQGTKPNLPNLNEKYGVEGCVISAVDLIKGIGYFAGIEGLVVEGATGNIHTNFEAKAQAAINAYEEGKDFVYLHLEGTDECSHQGSLENKIKCAEYIDQRCVKHVVEHLKSRGERFKVLVVPDHRTPLSIRTHSSDPVPYLIYDSENETAIDETKQFNEKSAYASGIHYEDGYKLTDYFFSR